MEIEQILDLLADIIKAVFDLGAAVVSLKCAYQFFKRNNLRAFREITFDEGIFKGRIGQVDMRLLEIILVILYGNFDRIADAVRAVLLIILNREFQLL